MKTEYAPKKQKARIKQKIVIISINDTDNPRTGGEYVYYVIKKTLENQGYSVENYSLPNLLKRYRSRYLRILIAPFLYFWLILLSLWKTWVSDSVVITSASPAFPLFGDVVYHQPKSSINTGETRGLSLYEQFAMWIHEYEILSPIWLLAKNGYKFHLSNSLFTKRVIKGLYDLDSIILYPPVDTTHYREIEIDDRVFSILVSRPRGISGIGRLEDVVTKLPKGTIFTVFGVADKRGMEIIETLSGHGYCVNYLGYVDEHTKKRLFSEHSHYLHLSVNEPFGITVIEAMLSGCVPVAHNSGGVAEYLPSQCLYRDSVEAVSILLRNDLVGSNLRSINRSIALRFDLSVFQKGILQIVDQFND